MLRASGPVPSRARLRGVEGLRALAASSVVVYHCWLYGAPDGVRVALGPLSRFALPNLRLGVTLFFTLSGFLLYRPIAAAVLRRAPMPSMRAYLRNRALRILPAYWVVLLVVGVLLPAALVRTPSAGLELGRLAADPDLLAANATFLQNYLPGSLLTGIGPAWSLSVEVVFYLLLPLLGVLAAVCARPASGRSRLAATLLPAAVLLAIGVSGKLTASWLVLPGPGASPGWDADWHSVLVRSFWGQADLFTFGMVLAVLHVALEDGRLTLPRWWWKAVVAAWALLVPAAVVMAERRALDPYLYETLMALACGLLLALVVLPDASAAVPLALIRGLEARPLVAVGLASYSLFLWHEPLVRWLRLHGLTVGGVGGFALNLVTLGVLSGLLAALTYRFVERPALRRKARRRPVPAGEPAPIDAGAPG
jgi:peptidoglycan/LPS O-acetylase OafA/YrhL